MMYFKKKKSSPNKKQLLGFWKEENSRVFRKYNNANTVWKIYILFFGYKTIQIIPVKLHYPITSVAFLSYFRRKPFKSE